MTPFLWIVLIIEIIFIIFAFFLLWSWLTKTPFYPSSVRNLNKLLDSKELTIGKDTKFIDIGSGDGRIVAWAAKKGADAYGIEFNPFLTLYSRLLFLLRGVHKKAKVLNQDFMKHDYSNYNTVYMFLFSEHMNKLKPKLFTELPKGSTIITNTFNIDDLEPYKVVDRFYFYKVK